MMPFRYTSQMSVEDAALQSRLLGVHHKVISIEPVYEALAASLAQEFAGTPRYHRGKPAGPVPGCFADVHFNKKGLLVLTRVTK